MPAALPLLVTNPINIRYLTHVELSTGILLLHSNKKILFVDGRYREKAEMTVTSGYKVLPLEEITKYVQAYKRIQFEADHVTVSRLERMKKRYRGTTLMPSTGIVEEIRRKKTKEEIAAIREACRITDEVLQGVRRDARPVPSGVEGKGVSIGVSEKSLAWEIEKHARDNGADAMAFETIVAFGKNTSIPHHSPTDRILTKGDLIQIDMGVKVRGYCSDCSRVFFTAEPTAEQWQIFELLRTVVLECSRSAKAKTTNYELDRMARRLLSGTIPEYKQTPFLKGVLEEYQRTLPKSETAHLDHFFPHSLGHGVGLEIHEGVRIISPEASPNRHAETVPITPLKEFEVITIEPGLYFPGRFGMRLEDTVLVRKDFGERLTKAEYYERPFGGAGASEEAPERR